MPHPFYSPPWECWDSTAATDTIWLGQDTIQTTASTGASIYYQPLYQAQTPQSLYQAQTHAQLQYQEYLLQAYRPDANGWIQNLRDFNLGPIVPVSKRPRAKARRLLRSNLAEHQYAMLKAKGYFVVESRSGRLYRIYTGIAQNIKLLDASGREVERLCAHPGENVPDFDAMLAQKLMLECCEEEFLAIANRQRLLAPAA